MRVSAAILLAAVLPGKAEAASGSPRILDADAFRHCIEYFNGMVEEDVVNYVPNAGAWTWIEANVPRFTCPDPEVERTYHYRWWVFRKHIKQTPAGFILTEFLPPVKHATDYNAISCGLGHHVAEGRCKPG